jgi:hypothetical protein
MNLVVARCGRFKLVQTDKGFRWCQTLGLGPREFSRKVYWQPCRRRWSRRGQWSPTSAEATAGLEVALVRGQLVSSDESLRRG